MTSFYQVESKIKKTKLMPKINILREVFILFVNY